MTMMPSTRFPYFQVLGFSFCKRFSCLDCDLPPTDVEEDLYLDKMIEDHLERRKNGEFFESTTGIRLADIIHAVEVERGNIKDNKKGTKKKATKSKAVKRPTQAPAAKPEVKRSRQR